RRRLLRDRRVVRDAGQGGEVARRPVRQGTPAGQGGVTAARGRTAGNERRRSVAASGPPSSAWTPSHEAADRRASAGLGGRPARDGVRQPALLGRGSPGP